MLYSLRLHSTLVLAGALATSSLACKSKEKAEATKAGATAPDDAKNVAKPESDAAPAKEANAWYLARLISEKPKAEVPFYVSVPDQGAGGKAVLMQGTERTELPVEWSDATHFEVKFGLFPSVIRASVDTEKALAGEWEQKSGSWGDTKLAMTAQRVGAVDNAKLFPVADGEALTPTEGTAVWDLAMNDSGSVKLELETKEGSAHGLLYFSSGNIIALAGRSSNGSLNLSGFDGTSAYLMQATYTDSGSLKAGTWFAGADLSWQETFAGKRVEDFEMETGPQMNDPQSGVEVAGVNLDAYKGKPLIVEMAGSWCITCRYAAPYLREIYSEFHPQGLEIVTLAYEFTDDEAYNKQRAQAFKEEYKLDWDVIPVMGGTESIADIIPVGLENLDISGFPISIFVGRDGVVKHMHAGFPGAKESESYETVTKDYRAKVAEIVAP